MNTRNFVLGAWCAAMLLLIVCFAWACHLTNKLDDTFGFLRATEVEAQDKRRERDTCLKLYEDQKVATAAQEASAKKSAEELATCKSECTDYSGLFNNFTAGVISTNVVLYLMDAKELKNYCLTNWEVNIGKNYKDAKLVSSSTFEVSRSRSGALFLVTCDWAVPSKLWCDKKPP